MNDEIEKNAPKIRPRIIPAEPVDGPREQNAGPPTRDNSRALAEMRARELRERRAPTNEEGDEYAVKHLEPDGWTYQWCTWSSFEMRMSSNIQNQEQRGWSFVPRSRHPELMPHDDQGDWIFRKGMVLMECPTEIVEEYKRNELKDARDQIRFKEAQIAGAPDGTMTRDHAQARPKISKSFEAMPIPDK